MKLIWVNADCLHRKSPVYLAYPDSPSIFVFDDWGWSLKRIGFVYECLLDLPVTIRQGDPVVEARRFAEEQSCTEGIVTMASPDPRIQAQALKLGAEVLPQAPFIELSGKIDLTRFSRYWRKAEPALLTK